MTALLALLGGVRATVFAGLLLVALGWGGVQTWRLGEAQDEAGKAAARATVAEYRIDGFRAMLVNVNAEADEQIAKAKERARAGEAAAVQAQEDADRLASRLMDARAQIEAAKADPTCAEQLEVKLCASIPLL